MTYNPIYLLFFCSFTYYSRQKNDFFTSLGRAVTITSATLVLLFMAISGIVLYLLERPEYFDAYVLFAGPETIVYYYAIVGIGQFIYFYKMVDVQTIVVQYQKVQWISEYAHSIFIISFLASGFLFLATAFYI